MQKLRRYLLGFLAVFISARAHLAVAQADDDKPPTKAAKSPWIDIDKESEDSAESADDDKDQGREPADSADDKNDNNDEDAAPPDADENGNK